MKFFIFAMMLGLSFAVTACGASDNGNGAVSGMVMGRYVEVDITPPVSGQIISLMTQDGGIAVFDEGLRTRFDSADGESWTQSEGPGSGTDDFLGVHLASFLQDGRILANLPGEGIVKISADGSRENFPVEEIDTAIANGDMVLVSMVQATDSGVLLSYIVFPDMQIVEQRGGGMRTQGGAEEETAETTAGTTMRVQGGGGMRQATVTVRDGAGAGGGRGMTFGGFGAGQPMFLHDTETGELLEEIPGNGAVSVTRAGDFFIAQDAAIARLSASGYVDTLIESAAFAFASPASSVSSVFTLEDGSIIVNVLSGGQNRLYRYTWDETAGVDPNKTLTVWSLTDNAFVRAAISELWRTNPSAYIVYEVALAGDGAVSASDAVRTLNTRLLSGSGPDILILDGTPIESYAGRGMLLNLAASINMGDIPPNLLAPFTTQGGQIYTLPTQLQMPVIVGDATALSEVQTLDVLVERIASGNPHIGAMGRRGGMFETIAEEDRAEIAFTSLDELFDILWLTSSAAIINDNQLNTDALYQFFTAMQTISDKYNLAEPQDETMRMGTFVAAGTTRGGAMPTMITGSLMQYMMQTTNFAAFSLNHLITMQMTLNRTESDFALFPGIVPGSWQPSTIAAISADTANPDFATQFISTLLSVEVQSINHGQGLPITRAGLAEQVNILNEQFAEADIYIDITQLAIINDLHTPALLEVTLRDMIWNTTERLCNATLDIQGAVREVEQSIRNYLAERS